MDDATTTPYSTIRPLVGRNLPTWVEDYEAERLAAYQIYEDLYWTNDKGLRLLVRGDEEHPLYVPSAREIVDTTAHFLLKGLTIAPEKENKPIQEALDLFLKREEFYSRFQAAKHTGVCRGDFVLHMTADELKPEGRRISLNSVDPAAYFPITAEDDPDDITGVQLVEQIWSEADQKWYVKRLVYMKEGKPDAPIITVESSLWDLKDWWIPEKATKIKQLTPRRSLDPSITSIPVWHFKNIHWDGWPYGVSELKGFERLLGGASQTLTDEDLALALEGLGVYATDAPGPTDDQGNDVPWEIAPARVMEVPTGAYFKRVEGIGSVSPMLDHINWIVDAVMSASATFRGGKVDVNLAESGIALAIRFLPTLAKIEQRELAALSKLRHLFHEWKVWHGVFEAGALPEDIDIVPTLGEKLPANRVETLNELNNLLDRKIISKRWYRTQVKVKLGYDIPEDIDSEIEAEQKRAQELALEHQAQLTEITGAQQGDDAGGRPPRNQPPGDQRPGNASNNRDRPNESAGTEAK